MMWRIAVWFACGVGLLEVAIVRAQTGPVRVGPQHVWMAPASWLLFFAVVALVLVMAGRIQRRFATAEAGVFAFSALGVVGLITSIPGRIRWIAIVMLAAGVAWQSAQAVARHRGGFERLVRRSVWWLVAVVAVTGLAMNAVRVLAERRVLAALPAPPAGAPNVLLLILDTVRARSLSLYGYERPTTPNLERLAQRAVVFDEAMATAPWTLPSHATIFTGRYSHEHGASWTRPLGTAYPTLAEVLATHGYSTAGFVANLLYCVREYGLARGFAHYEDYPVSLGQVVLSSGLGRALAGNSRLRRLLGYHEVLNRKDAATITDDFLAWLRRRDDHRPFFAFLNYFDAHEPYLPPADFAARFEPPRRSPWFDHTVTVVAGSRAEVRDKWALPSRDAQAERAAYEGAIAYLDEQIGRLLADLERQDLLRNTIVIVTADHGEQFGEHGLFGHINSLYEPVLHVPLIVSYPAAAPGGTRVPATVSLRDLSATVLDLAGLEPGPMPGASLARFWKNEHRSEPALSLLEHTSLGEPWYPVASGVGRSVVFGGYHMIEFARPQAPRRVELYDLARDPGEASNLIENGNEALVARLRGVLDSLMAPAFRGAGAAPRR